MQSIVKAVTEAATGQKRGGDAKFFQTTKKGEIHELKSDLNSFNKDKIKDAVKKVIAAMTVGKDVSTLFTDVVKSMQTDNIELKKLVYLYIINYARSQPDKAILIVNTFQKDATDKSPLVRALAIRTMGCIRVDRITEYLCEPLSKALKDKDPYVRKTAAVCVAKLYDINKDLVEEQGFLAALRDMIADPNPMVVANAVAALAEISETSNKDVFNINANMLAKLLAALNECTEWGQVFILDCLAKYEPNEKEAEDIVERVSPRLKHANSAVAMSAVKVIMKYLDFITNKNLEKLLIVEKLPPPLITLLSEQKPEIQYVALRNINLIVQKQPAILANGVKHFFCKYNDPIYVKMEKLEIMIKLASIKNIEKVLMEFKEYATEVDVEFVRKSVLAIGRCAIKLDQAAEKCIKVLLELIQTKVNYVVQEAIIVIKDIFRKYPNRYESIIATLCENLDTLDEPEAKASMIWIIGEYADRIDNAPELLESFVEHFEEENTQVQLQLLTAVVKLFLKRPEDAKDMVASVLNMATTNSDNPDLRDRGYVYWRLLSTDPEAAQTVVLTAKPVISDDTFQLDNSLLNLLISNISTLASVYHKPPEFFVKDGKSGLTLKANKGDRKNESDDEDSEDDEEQQESNDPDEDEDEDLEEDEGDEAEGKAPGGPKTAAPASAGQSGGLVDLLGLGSFEPAPAARSATPSAKVVLTSEQGKGLQLRSRIIRKGNASYMEITFENQTSSTLSQFAIKFNDNYVGIVPGAAPGPLPVGAVAPGSSKQYALPLAEQKPVGANQYGLLQVAIKTELGVFYFNENVYPFHLFDDNGKVPDKEFLGLWKAIDDSKEQSSQLANRVLEDTEAIKKRFEEHNVFFIASRQVQGGSALYFSVRWRSTVLLIEVKLNGNQTTTAVKSENVELAKATSQALATLLTQSSL